MCEQISLSVVLPDDLTWPPSESDEGDPLNNKCSLLSSLLLNWGLCIEINSVATEREQEEYFPTHISVEEQSSKDLKLYKTSILK